MSILQEKWEDFLELFLMMLKDAALIMIAFLLDFAVKAFIHLFPSSGAEGNHTMLILERNSQYILVGAFALYALLDLCSHAVRVIKKMRE